MEAVSFGGTNTYSNDEVLKTQFAKGPSWSWFSGLKLNDINKFMSGKMALLILILVL
jgi:zinc protease